MDGWDYGTANVSCYNLNPEMLAGAGCPASGALPLCFVNFPSISCKSCPVITLSCFDRQLTTKFTSVIDIAELQSHMAENVT